jgi:putative salt-induced outer membrane protein
MRCAAACALLIALCIGVGTRALAEPIPDPVGRMITAAAQSGKPGALDTVADVAKTTYPASAGEIDALVSHLKADAEDKRIAELQRLKLYQGWTGQGELGASRTSGNTDATTVAIGLHASKDGIHWRHKFDATADYQRSNNASGTDKYLAGYEGDYKFNPALFVSTLAQWEKDRFAGFYSRTTESLGVGYSVYHTPRLQWDISAGPAWRQIDQVQGPFVHDVSLRLNSQTLWHITPATDFTETVNIYAGGNNNTYESTTALTTKVIGALAARGSFDIKKETSPAPGAKKVDTTSRMTLVYGF